MTLQVLVVDDSAVVREAVTAILGQKRGIAVSAAADPLIAMDKMRRVRPDVILLDLEMPRMNGLTFLKKIMAEDPIPVVVCSAHTGQGTQLALRALEEGAVEVVTKPRLSVREFLWESAVLLTDAVRAAACARLAAGRSLPAPAPPTPRTALPLSEPVRAPARIVAIGASTGGTEALRFVLGALPRDAPPMVVVQHMPEGFTRAFAERLDRDCAIEVKEAAEGDALREGRALIAPGNRHLRVRRQGSGYVVEVSEGPLVSRHRPSVDVLFESVAAAAGADAVGVLMTGMGDDGARGLLEMKRAGALTLAQDEESCVVFGMPKEAIERGGVDEVVPLSGIASRLMLRARGPAAASAAMGDRRRS